MKIKNKYEKMLKFAFLFDKFNDANDMVDINKNDYTYQALMELNESPIIQTETVTETVTEYVDSLQEIIDKYDFDGDGKISIIDLNIVVWIFTGIIDSSDPKYNSTNGTYNGKSLDLNNDDDAGDIADAVKLANIIKAKLAPYLTGNFEFDYQEQLNDIKSYYRNHNYTWPTLEQIEYFKTNGTWLEPDAMQEIINKYDFDNDGIISIIDMWIPAFTSIGVISSADPKYDAVNKTYNGKSLDIDEDNTIDIADSQSITRKVNTKIKQYFGGSISLDYNEQLDDIKSYYRNHNYTWPTLEQIEYFKTNGTWSEPNQNQSTEITETMQEFVNKYDFDGDNIISIIDIRIAQWAVVGIINSSDPKYNTANKTYNGKSLDLNNDGDFDINDGVKLANLVKTNVKQYIAGTLDFDYQEQEDDIRSYYKNHNYTWPTLEQVEYFKTNGTWQ